MNTYLPTARITGLAFIFSTAIVMVANIYLLNGLVIPGDASATADSILAQAPRFRTAIALNVAYAIFVSIHLAGLFVLLRAVNPLFALSAAILRIGFVSMWMLSSLNMLNALAYLGQTPYLDAFEPAQLEATASMLMRGNGNAYYAALPLYATAMILTALLWYRSGLVARWFALFGVFAAAWCLFCAFAYLLDTRFATYVNVWAFDTPMVLLFEVALSVWLVIRGPKVTVAADEIHNAAARA